MLCEDNVQGSEVKTLSQNRSNDVTIRYLIQNSFAVGLFLAFSIAISLKWLTYVHSTIFNHHELYITE